MRKKKKLFLSDPRLFAILIVGIIIASIIIIRLFVLQVVRGKTYREISENGYNSAQLTAKRGDIFVKEFGKEGLFPVALNKTTYLVYAEPKKIQNKTLAAGVLAQYLDLDKAEITKTLFKNDPYEPIAHYVSQQIKDKIANEKVKGIGFEEEMKRSYPERGFGGQILGFVGFDKKGLAGRYGLEGYFDKELKGEQGAFSGEKNTLSRLLPWAKNKLTQAQDGKSLVLTIDKGAQDFVCSKIKSAVSRFEAEMGTIIVSNPHTGAIIAMCSAPDYDPNNYNKVEDQSVFNIPAIFNQYEPGSVFKPITMAAAIDAKLVNPESTYVDEGSVYIKPHTIKNSDEKSYGTQTMTQVLEKSLNTGVIHIVKLLGAKKFREYVEDFGFGQLTGIELDKEALGDISSLKKWGEIWSATASYGQGISVTPIQMINAFNVLANGGKLMKPYVVEKIIDNSNIKKIKSKEIRQVISARTSILLRGMLASVVENGHAKQAAVAGYYVGGKTGTAQVSKKTGSGYQEGEKIATFVGMAPADNPRFTILVRLDNPKAVEWASGSSAPVFSEVAKFLLNYYKVPPER